MNIAPVRFTDFSRTARKRARALFHRLNVTTRGECPALAGQDRTTNGVVAVYVSAKRLKQIAITHLAQSIHHVGPCDCDGRDRAILL